MQVPLAGVVPAEAEVTPLRARRRDEWVDEADAFNLPAVLKVLGVDDRNSIFDSR
jgi:hypothetical protein